MVDDEYLDHGFLGFQLKSELRLNGAGERGPRIGCR
jgi:hypothetical protein